MTAVSTDPIPMRPGPFARAENWLDDKGKGAWIAAMVLGFVFIWPIGLALLIYMIWSKRMFSKHHRHDGTQSGRCGARRHARHEARHRAMAAIRPSGNAAFDAYKAETLRRLEDEQRAFEEFLERLREAKDKAEFDEFMDNRSTRDMDEDDAPKADA